MEHRWGQRFSVNIPVRIVLSPGVVVWGRLRDLSATGAFVESVHPLPVSALVSLETQHRPVPAVAASVIRSEPGGAGLEWCEPWDEVPEIFAHYRIARAVLERALHAA